jgi:hypothetical protein
MVETCTKCNKPRNNENKNEKNVNCLMSRMQDGRSFTDYRPRCTIQYQNKNETKKNSHDMRMYLQHNADKLMKMNESIVSNNNVCPDSIPKDSVGTMLPERNMVQCNNRTCNFNNDVNMYGLGTGRIYK